METVLRLVKDYIGKFLKDILCDLLAPVGGQTVHDNAARIA